MIKVSNKLATTLILEGENRGSGFGKVIMKDGNKVNVNFYDRYFEDTLFHLIEVEETDEFYALEPCDKVITDSEEAKEFNQTLDGLKNSLEDVISILKDLKEGEH